jgi:hypothetical protein
MKPASKVTGYGMNNGNSIPGRNRELCFRYSVHTGLSNLIFKEYCGIFLPR